MLLQLRVRRQWLLWALAVGALLLFSASLGTQLWSHFAHGQREYRILIIDEKLGVATWYSSLLLAMAAGIVVSISQATQAGPREWKWHWLILAGLLLVLSLSKLTSAHKIVLHLADTLSDRLGLTIPRLAFGVVLLLLLMVVYLKFLISLQPRVRWALLAAGGVYLTGLVVLDIVDSMAWRRWGGESAMHVVTSNLEELTEMAGSILLIRGFLLHYRETVPAPEKQTP